MNTKLFICGHREKCSFADLEEDLCTECREDPEKVELYKPKTSWEPFTEWK